MTVKELLSKRILFAALLAMLLAFNASAETYVFKTYLQSSAMPIRLEVNGTKCWLVPGNERVELDLYGHISYSCTDAYGQSLDIETARMDDGTINAYIGGIMPSWDNHGRRRIWGYSNGQIIEYSSDGTSDYSGGGNSGYSQDDNGGYNEQYEKLSRQYGTPEEVAKKIEKRGKEAAGFVGGLISNGDRQFMIRALFSRAWGTGGRLEARFGGGVAFAIYGGLGKCLAWKLDNKDKLSWHAGIGLAIPLAEGELMDPNDISFGLTYGETPIMANKALLLDIGYSHYFGSSKRFGVYASAGFGLGNFNEDIKEFFYKDSRHFIWDVTAGLTFRF